MFLLLNSYDHLCSEILILMTLFLDICLLSLTPSNGWLLLSQTLWHITCLQCVYTRGVITCVHSLLITIPQERGEARGERREGRERRAFPTRTPAGPWSGSFNEYHNIVAHESTLRNCCFGLEARTRLSFFSCSCSRHLPMLDSPHDRRQSFHETYIIRSL